MMMTRTPFHSLWITCTRQRIQPWSSSRPGGGKSIATCSRRVEATASSSLSRLFIRQRQCCRLLTRHVEQPKRQRRFSASSAKPTSTEDTKSESSNNKNNDESGLFRLLGTDERKILQEQRALVAHVRKLAKQDVGLEKSSTTDALFSSSSSSAAILEESAFCIVLAGEFNAGKTTILNALLGKRVLETGALPTTDAITIVSSAAQTSTTPSSSSKTKNQQSTTKSSSSSSSVLHYNVPDSDLLQDLTLVDTPGTNAVLLDHTATTLRLLPAADLILFCTSADRPFPESERQLLASMAADYRKRIVVVINKMDLLSHTGGDHGAPEKQRVIDFVTEHTRHWLGAQPLVLAISAQDALSAKLNHPNISSPSSSSSQQQALKESSLWKRSNFAALESFLRSTLTTKTKIQAKLLNPIGLVDKVLDDCLQQLGQQQEDLHADVTTLQLLSSQVQAWQNELARQMLQSRQDVRASCEQEAKRGSVLLRRLPLLQYYRLTLMDKAQLERQWQDTGSLVTQLTLTDPLAVQSWIQETAQGLAIRSRAQGQALMEFLGARPSRHNQSLVGHVLAASRFEEIEHHMSQQLRQAMERQEIKSSSSATGAATGNNDTTGHKKLRWEEAHLIESLVQSSQLSVVLHGAGLLTGAIATSSALLDLWVGAGTALTCFGLGSAVLWQGRNYAVQAYADNWTQRGQALDETLEKIGASAMSKVERRIQDGIAPYRQFIQAEVDRLEHLEKACHDAHTTARRLRNRIGKL